MSSASCTRRPAIRPRCSCPESATEADIAAARTRWGLDQPVYVQYGHFLANTLQGDLGTSFRFAEPVRLLIAQRFPATIELTVLATFIAVSIAIPLGALAGARPNSWTDNVGTTAGLFGISVPSFWSAIMLILVFAGIQHVVPSAGRSTYGVAGETVTGFYVLGSLLTGNLAGVGDAFSHLAMPAVALGAGLAGIAMRITRSAVLEAQPRGLRCRGARQGVHPARHAAAARAAQCAHPGRDDRRSRVRRDPGQLGDHRDGLRLAGRGQSVDHRRGLATTGS